MLKVRWKGWRFFVIGPKYHVPGQPLPDFVRHLLLLIVEIVVVVLDEFDVDPYSSVIALL